MFREHTTFILGAGASKEVNLPTGAELKSMMATALAETMDDSAAVQNKSIRRSLQLYTQNHDPYHHVMLYYEAGHHISRSLLYSDSIDNFLEAHSNNKFIERTGKLAICASILEAEHKSLLYVDPHNIYNSLKVEHLIDKWYVQFGRFLVENCTKDQISTLFDNVTIIDFDYDRCIEQYLLFFISDYFGISREEATNILSNLKILHPYGNISSDTKTGSIIPRFGTLPKDVDLLQISFGIKTYSEQIDDPSILDDIRSTIVNSRRVVFLGFGFHTQNMKILYPSKRTHIEKIFLSTYGIPNTSLSIIREMLAKNFLRQNINSNNGIHSIENLTCGEALNEYRKGITNII